MKVTAVIAIVIIAVLSYGYWHASTHASFFVSLNLEDNAEYTEEFAQETEIRFLDSAGRVLAHGVPDRSYNFVHLIHPAVGDCHDLEKTAAASRDARTSWQECFEQQSLWVARWIGDLAEVTVTSGNCLLRTRPLSIRKSNPDWYLWWVPLPHVGGTPYSDYSLTIIIDKNDCLTGRTAVLD